MQAQNIIASGNAPVALFTGNSSDTNKGVYLLGRNSDSGTRLATFGECGYGANQPPQQYKYNSTTDIELYPSETINGIFADTGNSGYNSGSLVAAPMTNTLGVGSDLKVGGASSKYASNYLIGYSGISDANGNVSNGLKKLTYNGVDSTTNNIANGSYSYWTYEHLYANPDASAVAKSFASSLGASIAISTTATLNPNVGLGDMKVGRNGDGYSIYANY
jgi:hypothetical protein